MKYELYQYLMTDLWLVGIVIIIYVVILIIKVLRKYTKSVLVRKEKAENARTLGEVIKQHRVDCKMTQEFVAEILGVSRQAISKWENGVSQTKDIKKQPMFTCLQNKRILLLD